MLKDFYERFDEQHYMKVFDARVKKGLCDQNAHSVDLPDHELVGKNLVNFTTKNQYTIEKVCKQWYHGWYISLLIQNKGSHTAIFWENSNCTDKIIIKYISITKETYLVWR